MKPPQKITTTEWSRKYRGLDQKSSAKPGKYNPDLTPWVIGMHEALDDPKVRKVVCVKSAQVGWTDGVLNNYIARRIDTDPCPMIIMFAKEGAAKAYEAEKFVPMVRATRRLQQLLPAMSKSRDKDNRWAFKGFAGGFIKLVGSNSASSVKSTPAKVVAIEEPDDCAQNLDGQGDTITLLEQRVKTFEDHKIIFGGTPTVEGVSRVESAYMQSDQRKFYVPCHLCNEPHVLMWENVRWSKTIGLNHATYGDDDPSTAYYECPHCLGHWSEIDKNRNVRRAEADGFGWRAHAPFNGVAGFYINEINSPLKPSRLSRLVEQFLAARKELEQGSDTKMRSFRNNTEGKSYAYSSDAPTVEYLMKSAEDYPEFSVPSGGCILTVGIDVQHDRFAICIRAWGAGEESWLVYWGEIYGQTTAYGHGAWIELEQFLSRDFDGLKIQAGTIDCSDGNTSDAVYSFIRKFKGVRQMFAGKGSSNDDGTREISTPPKVVDYKIQGKETKADKYGVRVHIIGTTRAKDLILGSGKAVGRLETINGARMHIYKSVRPDYFGQVVDSEVKAPHKTMRGRMTYVHKSGTRNEGLDTEVYALHAARTVRLHLLKPEQWAKLNADRLEKAGIVIENTDQETEKPVEVTPKISRWARKR